MSHRTYTVEEKLRIIDEAQQPEASTAAVCRKYGVPSSVYYRWEAKLREGGREALVDTRGGHRATSVEAENAHLKAELARKDAVIVELTEALIASKKGLSGLVKRRGSRQT